MEENKPNPVGRPRMYKNAEELQARIDEFFNNKPYGKITIHGLVRYLGFADRAAFYDYENRPEFCHTIKDARNRIAEVYEEFLQSGLGAGAIFALKNFGWKDNQGLELSGSSDLNASPITFNIKAAILPVVEKKETTIEAVNEECPPQN